VGLTVREPLQLYSHVRVELQVVERERLSNQEPPELVHIGAVAEQTGLSLRTLRHYDEVGLVAPSGRTEGGFRLYSYEDVERLLLIRRMKPLGFTLEEMAQLLAAVSSGAVDTTASAVGDLLEEARARREQLVLKLAMADEFIALLDARASVPSASPATESPD